MTGGDALLYRHRDLGVMELADGIAHARERRDDVVANTFFLCADGAFELGSTGDDIRSRARMELPHGDDRGVCRVDLAGNDRLERHH